MFDPYYDFGYDCSLSEEENEKDRLKADEDFVCPCGSKDCYMTCSGFVCRKCIVDHGEKGEGCCEWEEYLALNKKGRWL